ncbi:MAG TPA: HNH endonuclease signature motif containing protein [Acidimicrobiales bacterium]|jgi:hypothetical protein|nr:HNH endonuclease signature motif containing protein [Acidimicrobiales bacterium]
MVGYAGRFDAQSLTPGQAGEVVRLCARIEASAASIKALAAARAAQGNDWKREGYRSAADALAHQSGMSPTSARRALETGQRLSEQPEVAQQALAGDLSMEQAAAVAEGVAANPSAARALLAKAKSASVPELNTEVARIKSAKDDEEVQRAERHRRRSLRHWTDRTGTCHAHLNGHPEDVARLWLMLDPIKRRLNALGHQSGQPQPLAALDYDALVTLAQLATGQNAALSISELIEFGLFPGLDEELATIIATSSVAAACQSSGPYPDSAGPTVGESGSGAPTATGQPGSDTPDGSSPVPTDRAGSSPSANPHGVELSGAGPVDASCPLPPGSGKPKPKRPKRLAGSPLKLIIRVDLAALVRGWPVDDEVCDMPGFGTVPVSLIRQIMATDSPFLVGLITQAETVSLAYHHGRRPNAIQLSALDWMFPTCAVEGCPATTGLENDHRLDYRDTRVTTLDQLDRLCGHHHRLKTHHNWALVPGKGPRLFVPPDDPRHPNRSSAFTSGPAPPTSGQ